ncbi:hypothetical protein N781_04380 [Pontibacillus halophilus JSM 076056 = DSM 19796]|uniref:Holin n=1 Tax=Pontibacillus halophilus JSM 076056 = DSM 19796 TaxID=1385510 RepID=A0A0A5GH01_9BACI|nr:hypothetical protein N781_04380 [Pontibacillus halophilus JSM 076056 = DSM 19796]
MKYWFTVALQFILINVFFGAGLVLQHLTHAPIPGSIFGLLLLFIALKWNVIKLQWVEEAGKWLLAELLLFFIPAAVGIVQYPDLAGWEGIRILLIIVVSTVSVMAVTGVVADRIAKRRKEEAA